MALPLPSRSVLAVSAVAAVGVGAGGYLLGRDAGTEQARTVPVPPLREDVDPSGKLPEVLLPGRTPIPPTVKGGGE